jgi:hypothetical protein
MTRELAELDLLLNEIDERCSPSEYQRAWISFLLECARLIEARMPKIASEALATGRVFAANDAGPEQLREEVRKLWEWCDRHPQKTDFRKDSDLSAVRAVLCVLTTQLKPNPEEFLDTTSFFCQLMVNVEPCANKVTELAKKHFERCI